MSEKKEIKNLSDCDQKALGYKVVCYACHGMYYDLNKDDPNCPYCQSLHSKTLKGRRKQDAEVVEIILDDTTDDTEEEDENLILNSDDVLND